MHVAEAGVVEGHAGQILSVGHLVAGLNILAVGHGRAQVVGNQLDGLDGTGVCNGCGDGRDIGFDGMGQGVHAGGSGQGCWLADHQHRVIDGDLGCAAPVDDGHLHLGVGVGDDAEAGHFRGGPGGGIDGHEGRHRLGAFVHALEVADMPAVADDQTDALGAVVRAAAAQRDDRITLIVLIGLDAVMNILVRRVGFGAVEDHDADTGALDALLDLIRHPDGGNSLIGHQQSLASAEGLDLITGLLGTANTHEGDGGDKKAISLIC